jgi:hypothetical protein
LFPLISRDAAIDTKSPGDSTPARGSANPVLWLVIILPLLSVVAGLTSLRLAVSRGDRELPANFHWEGGTFDADQDRLAMAATMGLSAEVRLDGPARRCVVTLHGTSPSALRLDLTHPTSQFADRHVRLTGNGGTYGAPCAPLGAAHWWVQLADEQGSWMLRGRVHGALAETLALSAQQVHAP